MTDEQRHAILYAIGFLVALYHGIPANPKQAKEIADRLAAVFHDDIIGLVITNDERIE